MDKDSNEMSQEFVEEKTDKKYIIIVFILYFIVIALTVLLIFGLRHQKEVIKNNAEKTENININNDKDKTQTKNVKTKTNNTKKQIIDTQNEEVTDIYNYLGQ